MNRDSRALRREMAGSWIRELEERGHGNAPVGVLMQVACRRMKELAEAYDVAEAELDKAGVR